MTLNSKDWREGFSGLSLAAAHVQFPVLDVIPRLSLMLTAVLGHRLDQRGEEDRALICEPGLQSVPGGPSAVVMEGPDE